MTKGPGEILSALSACGPAVASADFTVYARTQVSSVELAFCRTAAGDPACLWLGSEVPLPRTFRTSGLHVHTLPEARVSFKRVREAKNVIALECIDLRLLWEFSVLISALIAQTTERGSFDVTSLTRSVSRWLALFSASKAIDRRVELGLWGELWVLDASSDSAALAKAWRGPESGSADFFLGGCALEVKTTLRAGVHHMSQTQLENRSGSLLSLCAEKDPQGQTCKDLVRSMSARAGAAASVLGALKSRESACIVAEDPFRYSLAMQPVAFELDSVPKVRAVDAGVSRLRYEVTLDFDRVMDHEQARAALAPFGIAEIIG